MSPQALPIEDVKDKLLTLDEVKERFSSTEPLDTTTFDLHGSNTARWKMESDWNLIPQEAGPAMSIEKAEGMAEVGVVVNLNGDEYRLTKDAFLEATSLIGITKQYAMKTPAHLLQPHVNYWFKNEGGVQGNTLKALSSNGLIYAFTKVGIEPFSNLRILEGIEDSARASFGKG